MSLESDIRRLVALRLIGHILDGLPALDLYAVRAVLLSRLASEQAPASRKVAPRRARRARR